MTMRFMTRLLAAAACVLASAGAASAQQILNVSAGVFTPHGEDSRVESDVLNANRTFLSFDIKDFNSVTGGAEYLAPLGDFFEAGVGAHFYRGKTTSVYTNFVDADGSEIEQELKLRVIPLSATIRLVATGKDAAFQPYFGAGVAVNNWRYSESGEFIDFNTPGRDIFRDTFVKNGNAVGPVALGGIRFNGGSWTAGGEVRYSKAEGDLDETFAADTIDVGGWHLLFTVGARFGR
jgi:hypothetical protein